MRLEARISEALRKRFVLRSRIVGKAEAIDDRDFGTAPQLTRLRLQAAEARALRGRDVPITVVWRAAVFPYVTRTGES